jgi:hypothetical protein
VFPGGERHDLAKNGEIEHRLMADDKVESQGLGDDGANSKISAEAAPETVPKKIADQPHHLTLWLSGVALALSTVSALFSGLQWAENHAEHKKLPTERIIERPRLSFDKIISIQPLVAGKGFTLKPGLPLQPTPPSEEHLLMLELRFINTGRSAGSVVLSTYGSILSDAWHVRSDSTSPVPPFNSTLPNCVPTKKSDWKIPSIAVQVTQPIEITVVSDFLKNADFRAVMSGDKRLTFCGILSYEDGFHDTLKTVWQGMALTDGKRMTAQLDFLHYWP